MTPTFLTKRFLTNRLLPATLLLTSLAACTAPAPDRGTAAQRAACNQRADDVFAKRNPGDKYRSDLYVSSQRDAPFGGYAPADPTADLQARYSRGQILNDCLRRTNAQPTS
jgi:hypothetical protein